MIRLNDQLLQQARAANAKALETLADLTSTTPEALVPAIAGYFGWHHATPSDLESSSPDWSAISVADASQRLCLVTATSQGLWLIVANPLDDGLLTWADARIHQPYQLAVIVKEQLEDWLRAAESDARALPAMDTLTTPGTTDTGPGISLATIAADASHVVRLVNATLYDAHQAAASDIHLENTPHGLAIRYRIDGVLVPAGEHNDRQLAEQVVSRLKVLAELDIAERRIPQDGRFSVTIRNRAVDVRLSVIPGLFGEDAVLRLLDQQAHSISGEGRSLATLGFDAPTLSAIRQLAANPYGMMLVTGPTGSGKTTTLYSVIDEINGGQDKIITIEDPVEYQLPGVLQIPVNDKKGLTFAKGLRSILRHDPDRILVGEIRDHETAAIAIQAALTGHVVYTTVHANTAFDVIGRFRHMNVDTYGFASALNGIVAQRLIRLVCRDCAIPVIPDAAALTRAGISEKEAPHGKWMQGTGCNNCRGTGYRGRKGIAEVIMMTDDMRDALIRHVPLRELRDMAHRNGTRFLREQAIAAWCNGETTLEEIDRVTRIN